MDIWAIVVACGIGLVAIWSVTVGSVIIARAIYARRSILPDSHRWRLHQRICYLTFIRLPLRNVIGLITTTIALFLALPLLVMLTGIAVTMPAPVTAIGVMLTIVGTAIRFLQRYPQSQPDRQDQLAPLEFLARTTPSVIYW